MTPEMLHDTITVTLDKRDVLLVLESLLALVVGWAVYHRLVRVRIGPALVPLRALRFNDQLVWGLVVGATIVLVPTRELAVQIAESAATYGKYLPLKSMVMFGGVGMNPQIDALRRGVDILVATPGRLLDHHQQGTVDLSQIEYFVLDEADRMLDMGFIHDVKKVLALLPKDKQSLLFSATFSDEIRDLANGLLRNPQSIQVTPRNTTVQLITQRIHPVGRQKKKALLAHIIQEHNWSQVLVFTRTKYGANHVADFLNKQGITAMALHGNKSQTARILGLTRNALRYRLTQMGIES